MNGSEGVLRVPQSSRITEASPSDCFVSYLRLSLGQSYHSAEKQSVYFYSPNRQAQYRLGTFYRNNIFDTVKPIGTKHIWIVFN